MPADVSVVIPALNEADHLPATLDSLDALRTAPREILVVDGGSTDGTREVAQERGAPVIELPGSSIGEARHAGALSTESEWLWFVDADTRVYPESLDRLLRFVRERDLDAASSRCRIDGPRRTVVMQAVINRFFPRLDRPVLPGFNTLVSREAYSVVGGYPDVPNEDTAFSRTLAADHDVAYHPAVLVETSGRRIAGAGLTGTLEHYLRLDWARLQAEY